MKKSTWTLLIVLAIAVVGMMSYRYVMYGGARNVSEEKPEFTISSKTIAAEFIADTPGANLKYLEKTVAVSGTVVQTEGQVIILEHDIVCVMKEPNTTIEPNQKVTIKGRLVGYDDLMGEIKLDQCTAL